MATRQKSGRTRAAGGRQTSQQHSLQKPLARLTREGRDRITSETGYDSVDRGIRHENQMEENSTQQLARYVNELDTETDRLKELGLGAAAITSQDLTRSQSDNPQDMTVTPQASRMSHTFHRADSPVPSSQRHFSVVNTLSPPVLSSQTRQPTLMGEQQQPPRSSDNVSPRPAHDIPPPIPGPIDTNTLNAFFQWQIQKDRDDRQERDRESQRQDSRWRDILLQ